MRFFARDYPRWQKEWRSLEERFSTVRPELNARTALEIGRRASVGSMSEMSLASADGEKFGGGHPAAIFSGNA